MCNCGLFFLPSSPLSVHHFTTLDFSFFYCWSLIKTVECGHQPFLLLKCACQKMYENQQCDQRVCHKNTQTCCVIRLDVNPSHSGQVTREDPINEKASQQNSDESGCSIDVLNTGSTEVVLRCIHGHREDVTGCILEQDAQPRKPPIDCKWTCGGLGSTF